MAAWRASFHREPELANQEALTRGKIVDALGRLEIPSQTFPGFNGVIGTVGAGRPGPVVALRADMDALPVEEATPLPFRSRFPGRMHACGHDLHMASLLGAGALLKRGERRLRGPVRLLFQPAEEEGARGGALPLLERGAFDNPPVEYVVGQHVAPEIPVGVVGWKTGPIMAAADHFILTVYGTGGHAGYPQRGADAVVVAAEIVQGLQTLVSRGRDPLEPVVISVGSIHGGTRHNILPDEVVLEGTVRTLRPETRTEVEKQLRHRVRHIAASAGARVRVEYRQGYPVTVNPPTATRIVVDALADELGEDALVELENPVMGAEDFSRYLERVPGTFLFLGVGVPGEAASPLHSPRFAPPDAAMVTGAAVLAAAAMGLQAR
jgi:amidohydrolase